jgi:ATP-binding cassette, subfamily C, type I secretion system permease/ATPase
MARPAQTPEYREVMRDLAKGTGAAALVGLFVNILHLSLPLYTIQVYDRVISSGSMDTLVALTGIVAVLLCFQAALDVLRHRIFTILGARMAARLGRPVFEAAVETTLKDGVGAATGAMRDLGDLRSFVASGAIVLPLDIAVTPLFVVALMLMHPIYGIIGLIGAAVFVLLGAVTEFVARRPAARANYASGAVHSETAAAIRNAEAITAMGMLPALSQRWRVAQGRALNSIENGRTVARALAAVAKTFRIGLQIAIVCTGATLVVGRDASGGTIIASAVISSRLLQPFEHLIDGWRQWVDAFAAFERMRDLLVRGSATRSRTPVAIGRATLVADRVSFVPQGADTPLIRNVSFRVEAGELLGVVGPSGAGKSTLARLVVGLWAPTAGGIFLDGQSTFAHERGSFGEAVGYLPQDPLLFEGKVRENIARFRDADMAEVIAAARAAGVHEMIGRLPQGYETLLTGGGARLSGGQRQRIGLARSLFGAPRMLVLDEPNSSLDAEGEAALIAAIEQARERGAAVLVVAQRMSILSRADRLLVLKDGSVSQFGDRAEVLETLSPRRAVPDGARVAPVALREGRR